MPEFLLTPRPAIALAVRLTALGWVWLALAVGDLGAQFLTPTPALKGNRTEVVKILREDKVVPADRQELFDNFFQKYALPQFAAKENLAILPKVRKDFHNFYFSQAPGASGAAHARVNELAMKKFNEMLRIKLSPDMSDELRSQINAVKFNVVMAIGDLNEQEPGAGSKGKPLPEASSLLLKIFNQKSADGSTTGTIDTLRFGTIPGIQRHAESEALPPEARGKIRAAMLAVVKQKQPPAGRIQETHDMLRRRCAETLGVLDETQPNPEVIKTLAVVLGDPVESPKARAAMASVLGNFKYTPDPALDFKSLVDQIGRFAVDSYNHEIQHAAKEGLLPSRRRLKTWIRYARDGVGEPLKPNSLAAMAGEGSQKIYAQLKALDAACDDPKVTDDLLPKKLNEKLKDLENLLPARGNGPKVAPRESPATPPAKEGNALVQRKPDRRKRAAAQSERPIQHLEPVSAEIKAAERDDQ